MFHFVSSIFTAGFKGKDCSVDIDLCSFGMCSEHTLICAEIKGGQNISCTCERGEHTFGRYHICHARVLTPQSVNLLMMCTYIVQLQIVPADNRRKSSRSSFSSVSCFNTIIKVKEALCVSVKSL